MNIAPAADDREQATRLGQSIWFRVMPSGLTAAALFWWLDAPPIAYITLCILTSAVAAFLANRAIAPLARSLKTRIGSRAAASFGLQYREFADAPEALSQGQFKILGIPVNLSDQSSQQFLGEMSDIFGSLGLPPASQAALDSALHFGLLPKSQKRRAADFWSGSINSGAFEMFQLELFDTQSSPHLHSSGDITEISFHGIVLSIETSRNCPESPVVCASAAGGWSSEDSITDEDRPLGRVPLDGAEAYGMFVYARDQVQAAALLSSEFVASWQAAKAAFGTADLDAVFHDGKVIAVIPTRPLFQLTSLDPTDDDKSLAVFAAELSAFVQGAKLLRAM